MPSNNPPLPEQAAAFREKIDFCADIIKLLSGYTPERFTFTFAVKDKPIVQFGIAEDESRFVMSFFMSWHSFYSREYAAITKAIELQESAAY